jgi:N-acetylneuraminic acid mutarotase
MKNSFRFVILTGVLAALTGCGGGGGGGSENIPHINWTSKTAMPTARTMLSSGMVNGKIYAIGGYTGSYSTQIIVSTVEEFDPAADTWTTKTSMPTARSGLASAVVNNIIYAIGGSSPTHAGTCNGSCSTVESYDPVSDTWTVMAPMLTQRNGMTGAAVNGIIYIMGGCCSISIVEAYDTATNTWTTKTPMPTAREGLTSAVVNGKIYAIGGGPRNSSNNVVPTGTVEEYDPVTNAWATKASMPTAREGLISAVVNGKIYAIGGFNGTPLSTVEVYDPVANTWSSISANYSMPTPRNQFTSEVVNGIIYAIGGYGATSLSTVEAFTPP